MSNSITLGDSKAFSAAIHNDYLEFLIIIRIDNPASNVNVVMVGEVVSWGNAFIKSRRDGHIKTKGNVVAAVGVD